MNLASLPLASSGDGVELLRAAAVLHKLKGTTDAVRPSSSSDTYGRHVVPGAVWSRIALYSKNPREIRQVLTAVSPSVRLALTPVSVSSTRSVSSGGFDAHDTPGQRPYTPSLHTATTPSTPRSPPPGLHLPHAGLSCDALRVHRWWLWGLGSFPLNLDVPLGTITSTVADGAAGGGGNNAVPQLDLNEGGGQWTPASIRSTTTPAQYITTSPLMLLGSGRTNSSSQVPLNRVAPNTAGTITEDVWREHHRTTTGGRTTTAPENQRAHSAAAAPVTTGVSASGGGGFDMFPSAPLDPVSLAFPFYEEHWDDCHVRAIHIRLLQDDHQQNNVVRQQQLQLPQQQRPGLGQSAVMLFERQAALEL
ncbi:Hypothetical protein, putative [Bodo saltans]|uniref:Uncharacterized protein n=1 Tax=Bodo saltans TaxID=75058 RepID=A0A0S4JFE3_BODSA|nr:Hypothetical protein, putative [Bodo saltans]|eukprot:CUG88999.1 Hypothetical protein, putative [Bodo saltans]